MDNKPNKKYFLAITRQYKNGRQTGYYDLFFVNDSDQMVKELILSSGGFCTADDEVIQTSVVEDIFIDIAPRSYVQIDVLDDYDFESAIWFNMRVVTEELTEELQFSLGKSTGFMGNVIPIVNKMGRRYWPY